MLVRSRKAARGRGAIFALDLNAIRGSVGRLTLGDWDYIVDRSNTGFKPVFAEEADA